MFVSYRRPDEVALARRVRLRWSVVFALAVSAALVLAAFGRPAEAAKNRSPTITSAGPSVVVDEGQTATNAGGYEDPDASDVVRISSSVGNVTKTGTNSGNWTWQYATTDGGVQSQRVYLVATDQGGKIGFTSFALTVANVAPTATFNSQNSVQEDSPFEVSLSNPDDPSPADKSAGFRYAFDCGDGRGFVDNGNVASRTCRAGAAGAQTVRGRISDKDGATQEYSAAVTVTPPPPRDLTPPDTNVTSGPEGTVRSASAAFEFASTETGSSFECSLDGGAFERCGEPKRYEGLSEGPHVFQVRATDGTGNTDATPAQRAWTVDTAAPETTVTAGPEEGSTGPTNTATFEFVSTEPNSDFECSLDGGAFGACASPQTYNGLDNGQHTFRVRARDAVGNLDATPASRTFAVSVPPPPAPDPPNTTITSGPGGLLRSTSATFEFSSSAPASSSFQCSLDGSAFADCASPWTYDQLAQGGHTFKVRALNEAGPDPTPASSAFTVDTAGPSITSVKPGGRTRDRTPTIGAVITDAQDELVRGDIQLFVDGAEVTGFAYDGGDDRLAYTPPRLGYGGHNLKIVATDSGENTTIHQHGFRVLRPR